MKNISSLSKFNIIVLYAFLAVNYFVRTRENERATVTSLTLLKV